MIIFYLCIFFLGASIASFLNATLYRIEKRLKYPEFLTKPSHCENCKKDLTWYELIPVLGYVYQKGKCSKCKTKINLYYPISEFVLGISILMFYVYHVSWYMWIVLIFLFVLSYYDFEDNSVPKNIVHVLLLFCGLIFLFLVKDYSNLVLPGILFAGFSILNLFKKSMGLGDLLILLALGMLLQAQEFLVLFWIGIILALLYSLSLVCIKQIKIRGYKIPMVPFLSMAFVTSVLYGQSIYDFFFNMISL